MKLVIDSLKDRSVALIPMELQYVDDLYQSGQYPEIWKWTTLPYCQTLENTQSWVDACLVQAEAGTLVPFVILDKASQTIVGSTSFLNIDLAHNAIEIGFTFLSPSAQRTHINRRCKMLLLRHAFEELAVNRVAFQTHEKNTKSRNAILGIGARFEGIIRHCRVQHDGSIRSSAVYSIIAPEWPEVKHTLQTKIAQYE